MCSSLPIDWRHANSHVISMFFHLRFREPRLGQTVRVHGRPSGRGLGTIRRDGFSGEHLVDGGHRSVE